MRAAKMSHLWDINNSHYLQVGGISDSTLRVFGRRFYCGCVISRWKFVPALNIPQCLTIAFFPFFIPSLSMLLLFVATLNMAMFTSTVYGYCANCLFDPQSPISTVSPSFSTMTQFNIRCRNMGIPVAFIMTAGVFSCPVDLQLGVLDNVYDLRLRRDLFNFCTTATVDLLIMHTIKTYNSHIVWDLGGNHVGAWGPVYIV